MPADRRIGPPTHPRLERSRGARRHLMSLVLNWYPAWPDVSHLPPARLAAMLRIHPGALAGLEGMVRRAGQQEGSR
jgi:hypothetical protein